MESTLLEEAVRKRVRSGLAAVALTLMAISGMAQKDAFDVASVRADARSDGMTAISPPGAATFTARNATLKFLIELAYGLQPDQIDAPGKMSWMDSAEYDVVAKREGETTVSYEQLKPRLQHLLEERFALSTHWVMKEMKGYALVVAKGEPKLTAGTGGHNAYILPNGLQAQNVTMLDLAQLLGQALHQPVVDRTGIAGEFEVKLRYAPAADAGSALPSIFTAVEEQLGLRLEAARVSVRVMVIDSVERTPVGN
jgi:uncharacterized protein (TIGR03435 family)